ncbi:CubicO group peptidase (beta-lactamase class C family) [Isoptericola jiangsuensis]|uniref:CubicO group peptidase (Beta-lactamase class C family) n=1 Tax=Isoptericola jiangsuensis TaxID=548579 RepID=A0A2A9EYZ9_9MICO|nr:serine hydrolase [Isoptericola jiangsuensis]PFG44284.1 CubicO group peptidase (beta-lactamase class C family) [Isoptericola jiangsuensis]
MTTLTALLAERARTLDVALHTVEVVVDGEVVEGSACAPLTLDTPHRMYSVGKSWTALAVGMLADDGTLRLEDRVVDHVGEQVPVHPWLERATVHDLLTMRGPHRATTYKRYDGPWLESWFRVPPTRRPGTVFTYDTSGSYVLSALVERLAGTSLAAFLHRRLLEPIGAGGVRFLPGPDGWSQGGSGLVCSARDLRRVAQVVLDGGVHDGRALLPPGFVAAMTSPQADTRQQSWGSELRQSYGFQTWLPARGGWLMFGLGGQLAWGDPTRRLLVVVTADTQVCPAGDQRLIDALLQNVVPRWWAGRSTTFPTSAARRAAESPTGQGADRPTDDPAGTTDGAGTATPSLTWPRPHHDAVHACTVTGRWTTHVPGAPADLSLAVGPAGGTVSSADAGWVLPFDLAAPREATVEGARAVVTAGWSGPGTLDLRCAVLGDELASVRLRLVLTDDGLLTVVSQGFGEDLSPAWQVDATYVPASGSA